MPNDDPLWRQIDKIRSTLGSIINLHPLAPEDDDHTAKRLAALAVEVQLLCELYSRHD